MSDFRFQKNKRCPECKAYLDQSSIHLRESIKECSLLTVEERAVLVEMQIAKELRKKNRREGTLKLKV